MESGNPLKTNPKTQKKEKTIVVDRRKITRPFPLSWGLAALFLFLLFAIVTQLQFKRISDDNLFEARMDTYASDLKAYEVAEKAYIDCLTEIERSDTIRHIFDGVSEMFSLTAEIPVDLFPGSEAARIYQKTLTLGIQEKILEPLATGLPPRNVASCPKLPGEKPTPPTR